MRPFTVDPRWYEKHWYATPRHRPASTRSLWTMTLGLAAYFLASSFTAALLATYYGWLGPR